MASGQTGNPSHFSSEESHPGTLLVFPFENESRIANLDWLGEGMSELTVERLLDGGLNVLSRQDRLAALERMGLPDTTRLSHATIVKVAGEADADVVVFGQFVSDGKTVTLEARVMHISPPSLSPLLTQTSDIKDLPRAHARLSWQILCEIDQGNCLPEGTSRDESSFSEPPPALQLDALENYVHGLAGPDDETRLRLLREAARLEPAWDRPAFELGQIYFERRDCETALPWLSRVPPDRADGPEASFDAGVCHLLRNDTARADAAFSGLVERARSDDSKERLPEFPEVRNNLGVSKLREGKWNEAVPEFARAAALDSEEPDYWLNLGIARLAGKRLAGAVTAFQRARGLDPNDKDARGLLISTLESLGRTSEAAAIRTDASQNVGRATPPNVPANAQDPAALAKLAHVSKKFDRVLLRTAGAETATQPSRQSPRKNDSGGGPR